MSPCSCPSVYLDEEVVSSPHAEPNARRQARLKAGATQERTLEAVACTPMFGPGLAQGPGETVPDPLPLAVPGHLMTLSARDSTSGATVKPICCAVFRLSTSANFWGFSTGNSAGLVPFRILST